MPSAMARATTCGARARAASRAIDRHRAPPPRARVSDPVTGLSTVPIRSADVPRLVISITRTITSANTMRSFGHTTPAHTPRASRIPSRVFQPSQYDPRPRHAS